MITRKIGKLEVSAVGYGCMGLSHGYGKYPERAKVLNILRQAFDIGHNFFDTAKVMETGIMRSLLITAQFRKPFYGFFLNSVQKK